MFVCMHLHMYGKGACVQMIQDRSDLRAVKPSNQGDFFWKIRKTIEFIPVTVYATINKNVLFEGILFLISHALLIEMLVNKQ